MPVASESDLEFGLLGPLEVVRDGQVIDLGKGRERAVLALLVIHANQVLPVDRFLDELWGASPPPSAPHALQVHVSNLRKRLEPDRTRGSDGEVLQTRKPGYLLNIDPGQLDVKRFDDMAERGRAAMRDGRADEAAALLRDALALWRGPAIADLAYEPWAEAEAGRLEDGRRAVLEDRFDADLAGGRHGEIVGELEAAASQHPLRERLWGQYMLALYRSGRQAEAVRAGTRLRETLRDELGLDPRAEIRSLETAILDQDPRLDLRPTPTRRRPSGPPSAEAEAASASAAPAGLVHDEQKVIAAVFADLTGSTALGEALDDEEFKVVVDEAVSRMIAAVSRYGGTVVNVAGDGILALFGAPVAHEDDTERAVRAGLELVGEVAAYGDEVAAAWDVKALSAHVGIHTGVAILGAMAAGDVTLTAMGDVVNTAARLESAAAPGVVLVSATTRRQLEPLFEFGAARAVELKGKREPMEVSDVVGARAVRGKVRGLSGVDTHLIGRQRELGAGRGVIDAVMAGAGGVLLVTGEAGLGKSRYLAEMAQYFDDADSGDRPTRWLTGRSLSYGERLPYWPFRELLRDWLGVTAQEPEVRVKVRMRSRLEELFGAGGRERMPFLGNLMGFRLDPDAAATLGSLSAQELRDATFEAITELFERLAADGPVVVALDDLHWADGDSIGLVDQLLALTESAAVLLIIAQRLERQHPSWRVHDEALRRLAHRSTEIALSPLGGGHDAELLEAMVGSTTLPDRLRAELLDAAEGNPFFLEELVRSLMAAGALHQDESGWRLDREVPIEVPETVEKVIQSRIDGLPPDGREVLTAGSVLGRQFDLQLLAAVVDDEGTLSSALRDLQRLEMVREAQRWPRAEFRFKHSLIQETAYRNLVPSRRQALHGRAARALEQRALEGEPEDNGLLAHHFDNAGEPTEALHYHRLAAADARAIYAQQAAFAHYDAALLDVAALPPDDDTTSLALAEVAFGRGELGRQVGNDDEARTDLLQALDAARRAEASKLELDVLTELGMLELHRGTYDTVMARFEDGLTAAEAVGDRAAQAVLLGRVAIESVRRLRFDQALSQAERAVDLAREADDGRAVARALDGLKLVTLSLGDLTRFRGVVDELGGRLRSEDDKLYLQHVLAEGAVEAAARGAWVESFSSFDEALELNRVTGNRVDEALLRSMLANQLRAHGRYGDALERVAEARALSAEFGHHLWTAWSSVSACALHLDLEDLEAALASLGPIHEFPDDSMVDDQRLRSSAYTAYAVAKVGDRADADAALAIADSFHVRTTCPPGWSFLYAFDADVARGRAHALLGDRAGAIAIVSGVLEAAIRAPWFEAIASSSLALAEIGADDPDAAGSHVQRAIEISAAHGLPGLEWRARAVAAGRHRRQSELEAATSEEARAEEVIDALGSSLGDPAAGDAFRSRARLARARLTDHIR